HVAAGMEEGTAVRRWLPLVIAAIELPAIELFFALRRGENQALGKLLPHGAEIIDFVEQDNSYGRSDFDHFGDSAIPHDFWTNSGIDWLSNAVTAHGNCYCDVSMSVEVLMSLFPGERTPVDGAQFVGDCLFVKEPTGDNVRQPSTRMRGRPPAFAWEAFHVEVTDLIKRELIPQKREAALQLMMRWIECTQY